MSEYTVRSSSELVVLELLGIFLLGSLAPGLTVQDTVVYLTSSSSLVSDSQAVFVSGSLGAHAAETFS